MDNQIEYLEMIQAIITRMANNSFLIKGWTITISLASLGFFFSHWISNFFLLILAGSILIFWWLDTYFLRNEKLFRALYEDKSKVKTVRNFSMDVSKYFRSVPSVTDLMFSFPICVPNCVVYISILIAIFSLFIFC